MDMEEEEEEQQHQLNTELIADILADVYVRHLLDTRITRCNDVPMHWVVNAFVNRLEKQETGFNADEFWKVIEDKIYLKKRGRGKG